MMANRPCGFVTALGVMFVLIIRGHGVKGICTVEVTPCEIPFKSEDGLEVSQCIPDENINYHKCVWNSNITSLGIGNYNQSWALCNGGCFDQNDNPIRFSPEMSDFFCKTKESHCMFPFILDGVTYNDCVETYENGENFKWCATRIDNDGVMVPGWWGKCDMTKCFDDDGTQGPKAAQVYFDQNGVVGEVKIEQVTPNAPLVITGTVTGLKEGLHGFHVHQLPLEGDDCNSAGGHFNPKGVSHGGRNMEVKHAGDFGNIEANEEGIAKIDLVIRHATLYGPDELSIRDRTLIIHELEDDLGLDNTTESETTGSAGQRIACGLIESSSEATLLIVIIIVVIIVIIILIALIICCIVCLCCKRKKMRKQKKGKGIDDPDSMYPNGDTKKKPLYDELSIPFIDASPAPTPKTGRSTERLSFFHRSSSIGRSRGSLSIPPAYEPPPPPVVTDESTREIQWQEGAANNHTKKKKIAKNKKKGPQAV